MDEKKVTDRTVEEERKAQKKRTVGIIVIVMCAVCLFALLFDKLGIVDLSGDSKVMTETQDRALTVDKFRKPDWETDIFTLSRYMEKNRKLSYKYGAETVLIHDENYAAYGDAMAFFGEYFHALTHGDHEAVNAMYTDVYLRTHEPHEPFTMQKIYDVVAERMRQYDTVDENGRDVICYEYRVTYKIMENDGTFRNDLLPDAEKAQFFSLYDDGRSVLINSIDYSYDPNR